jgi:hypothetical protein
MEVKSIYMDLQEWVKKWNVWKLESEAFKKPIEIKIWYDNSDLKDISREIANIKHESELHDKRLTSIEWENVRNYLFNEEFQNKVNNKQSQIDELREKIKEKWTEINELYKVIADLKTTVETLSGTILQLQKKNKEIEKKLTVQPRVFNDKIFISWREEVMLGLYDIPDWDYLCITSLRIWEHNEYVNNKDEVLIDKIHVEDWFTPRYQLYWGTELDTPTATVYYTLLLMPI